jgi:signal transduction histidine kinase
MKSQGGQGQGAGNTDFLATYRILRLLEQSKSASEAITDELPGIFVFIDAKGTILRGNRGLANFLDENVELLNTRVFNEVFDDATWTRFRERLSQLGPDREKIEFELPVDKPGTKPLLFVWEASRVDVIRAGQPFTYFRILGHDISELRKKERHLAEIYSSLPLGLMTVDYNGCIDALLSEQSALLLGQGDLIGRELKQVLFAPNWARMPENEKRGVNALLGSFGKDLNYFEVMRSAFPTQVFIPREDLDTGGKYLGLLFQPLARAGKVERLFVSVEDRTRATLANRERERVKQAEEESIKRILEVKRCPEKIAPLVYKELETFYSRLSQDFMARDLRAVKNSLHSLKGVVRLVGFEQLGGAVHQLETDLGEGSKAENFDLSSHESTLAKISADMQEYRRLMSAVLEVGGDKNRASSDEMARTLQKLFQKFNTFRQGTPGLTNSVAVERVDWAIRSTGRVPLRDVREITASVIANAAKETQKKVKLRWEAGDILIDQDTREILIEALTHLGTNALAHGIETPEARKAEGKPEEGVVRVTVSGDDASINVVFKDDGRGIDPHVVKMTALKRGVLTPSELSDMNGERVIQLILSPGFSTASAVTQLSGRGVGLDAVASAIRRMGGEISVRSSLGSGSEFQFSLRRSGLRPTKKTLVSLPDFHTHLLEVVETQRSRDRLAIQVKAGSPDAETLSKRPAILMMDLNQTLVCVTNAFGVLAERGLVEIEAVRDEAGGFRYKARVKSNAPNRAVPSEYALLREPCETWMHANSGRCAWTSDAADITVGRLLKEQDFPRIVFAPGLGFNTDQFDEFGEQLQKTLAAVGVPTELLRFAEDRFGTLLINLVNKRDPKIQIPQIEPSDSKDQIKAITFKAIENYLGLVAANERLESWQKS